MSDFDTLEDLQSRLAFQEQTLTDLNEVVARQTEQIDRLEQQLRALAGKYRDLRDAVEQSPGEEGGLADERPPHY
ncbi:SlyX family protein [Marinimicrobium sp. C6131]|uniref:SlyX family protein n=1 Tax=Marinimicrobium sp. C6131 TaxID=3022676 RepID=UPI00223E67D3|nr:SlyX family protein [Marinimicrobium sp. C6131]UZJ45831.1 SlyX family protein [Marinimicrobium sp. C6131]